MANTPSAEVAITGISAVLGGFAGRRPTLFGARLLRCLDRPVVRQPRGEHRSGALRFVDAVETELVELQPQWQHGSHEVAEEDSVQSDCPHEVIARWRELYDEQLSVTAGCAAPSCYERKPA